MEQLSNQYLRMEGFQKHMLLHRNRDAVIDRLLLQVQQDLLEIRRSLTLLKIAVRGIHPEETSKTVDQSVTYVGIRKS